MDIASLGISIDSSDATKAEAALDSLAATGAKSEAAAKSVGDSWTNASKKASASTGEFKKGSEALREQQLELGNLLGKIDPVVGALGRLDEQEAKLRQFRGKGLLDTETFNQYQGKLDQARNALVQFDNSLTRTGNTAKQNAQALRQLPAQFSDIFISLQAGQSPLQVFLQQGAQIKDSFGGVGPALRATAGAVVGMINPVTIAAAALAAMALAYKQGSDEATAFNTALILTGNAAGTSVDQLQNAAAAIDGIVGTQRQAAAALAEVAGSGKFTADQITSIATAAVAMEEATGKAVSDTINEFKRLADEPAAAAAKLNERYNFLTASIFEQITALEAQGDAAGAAQLAIDTFGEAMVSRANEITEGLGYIEAGWAAIKKVAAETWDEMLGVGRSETPEQRLETLAQTGVDAGRVGNAALFFGAPGAAINFGQQLFQQFGTRGTERNEQIAAAWQEIQDRDEKAWVEGMAAQQEEDAIAAQQRIDQLKKSTLTNAEKRNKALGDLQKDLAKIRQVNPDDARLQADSIARLEANIKEQFKDPKVAKTPAFRDDAATKMLIALRQQSAELETQLASETKLTAEQKKRAEFESLIADLKTKDILTADQKSLLANQDAIKAQLDTNVALAEEVRLRLKSVEEAKKLASFQEQITNQIELAQDAMAVELSSVGRGSEAANRLREQLRLEQQFSRQQSRLQSQFNKGEITEKLYREETQILSSALNEQLQLQEDHYRALDEAQQDWKNGATSAFEDYLEAAKDVSGQTKDLFSNALGSLEDAFVEFAMTGKVSFKELVNSILADLARIAARQLTANLAQGLMGSFGGGGGFQASSGPSTRGGGGTNDAGTWLSLLSSFAGFFDSGGNIGAGGWGIVGERGPEIVRGPANVVGREQTSRMMAGNSSQVINMSFPGINNAREAREATATAARQLSRVAAGAARYN